MSVDVVDRVRFDVVGSSLRVFVRVACARYKKERRRARIDIPSMRFAKSLQVKSSIFRMPCSPNRLIDGRRERGRDRREELGHDAT